MALSGFGPMQVTAGSGPSVSLNFTNGSGGNTNQPVGYTYDPSGNMVNEPIGAGSDYTYDGENRMVAYSGNGGAATYMYDGNGLRVEKSVQSGTTTVSIFDGSSVIDEYDNGALPASPSREYIYGAGQALAMISGSNTDYFLPDHLSTRVITDASGTVLTQEGHFPFGEAWYQTGQGNSWFFTSYKRDTESGLDYAIARYFDSRTGTFCSADPLAGSPDDPQSWNRYPYGRNDPINLTDPSGKSWWSDLLIGVGIGFAAYFLPEIAPSLFGSTAASGGSLMLYPGATIGATTQTAAGGFLIAVDNPATQLSWSSSISFGVAAGGMSAMANSPQGPRMPATPQARFINCNHQYGTPHSQGNLTYQGYQDAAQAAQNGHIPLSNELSLWDNENSLKLTTSGVGPAGEVGPMQLTPPAYNTLSKLGQLPSGWNNPANPEANLLAGARYFAHLLKSQPLSNAAAVYNGGTGGMNGSAAQNYQKNFNSKNAQFQKMVNCIH